MAFSVTGRMKSFARPVTIRWDNGVLSGDRGACDLLREHARAMEGFDVGPVEGPYTRHNHLADGLSTVFLIRDLLEDELSGTWHGDIPTRDAGPINDGRWIEPVWNTGRKGRNV